MTLEEMEKVVDIFKSFNKLKGRYIVSYFHPKLNGPITEISYMRAINIFEIYTNNQTSESLKVSLDEAESLTKYGVCKREILCMDGSSKIKELYKLK